MKKVLLAAVLSFAFAAAAQASPLPPDQLTWTFNWQPGSPSLPSDNSTGGVTFTSEPELPGYGNSDVVATNLRTFSLQLAANPEVLATNGAYSLTINLKETEDGNTFTGSVTFTGKLSGTFSAEHSLLKNEFTDGGPKSVAVGSYVFTVSLTSYTPPGPPDQTNAGSIGGNVSVRLSDVGHPSSVPEPSTLALSCLGGVALLGGVYRRWKTKRLLPG